MESRDLGQGALRAAALAAAFLTSAALVVSVDTEAQFGVRAVLWLVLAAIAAVVGTRRRPEPRTAWAVAAVGAACLAFAWMARFLDETTRVFGGWDDVLSGIGLFAIGAAMILAGSGPRERVALLDGAIFGGAAVTFAWAILLSPQMADQPVLGPRLAAGLHVAGGCLVLGVGVALALAERDEPPASAPWLLVAVAGLTIGGVGWGWQGLQGNDQAFAGSVGWLLAPLALIAVALVMEDEHDVAPRPTRSGELLTPTRFAILVGLTVMPGITVGLLRAAPSMRFDHVPVTMGLWVTVVSVVLLALRIRSLGGYAIEDVRTEARDRFAHLIENSADVVAVIGADGTFRYCSPSTRRVFAHDPEALVGRHVAEYLDDDTGDRLEHLVELARGGGGRPVPMRVDVVAGDGLSRPAEGTISDLSDVPSVGGLVVTLRDISERVALEHELKRAALEDPLTGLANRTLLSDRLEHALAAHSRGGAGVALLFIDLDDFKSVNDRFGHAAGDRVLQIVSQRIRSVVRDIDTAGRLGGDEFAVVLEGLDRRAGQDTAQVVVDRLREELGDPVPVGNTMITIGASIGIAVAVTGISVAELVRQADTAMYAAKDAGKGDVRLFHQGLSGSVELP